MAIWKCKFCGAPLDVPESGNVASCEYCGVRQTVPKLDDDRRNLLLDRAGQFLRSNEYDRAAALYEQAITEGGDDPELYWSLVLCRYGIQYVEDPTTHRRLPTVNRTQYIAVSADPDYREALSRADGEQRELYVHEAAEIDAIQRGILEISQKEEPFDVFICYKETDANGQRTPDSVLAQELYYGLKGEGFKVFFSRISLEDKLGSAYEPYIFSALHSAKVMVAIGTKPDHFKAVWVKNEWNRFLALIKQGEKKVLIPAYRDMDPYDLPDEFAALQALDMGKLGFMQDLIRGIKKIIDASSPKTERAAFSAPRASSKTDAAASKGNMLERGFLFLEDQEWKKADDLFEKVLNVDLHESRAYLGKLLASRKLPTTDALVKTAVPIDEDKNFGKALRFADDEYRRELKALAERIRQTILSNKYNEAAAIQLDNPYACHAAAVRFRSLGNYLDSPDRAAFCEREKERFETELASQASSEKKNTRLLRFCSIVSVLAALLFTFLPSRPPALVFSILLVFGGLVVSILLHKKSAIPVVFVLPSIYLIIQNVTYSYIIPLAVFSAVFVAVVHLVLCFTVIQPVYRNQIVPAGTQTIHSMQFAGKPFSTVAIPSSVKRIEYGAFVNCINLTVIYYEGTKDEWNAIFKHQEWISGMQRFTIQCIDGHLAYNRK